VLFSISACKVSTRRSKQRAQRTRPRSITLQLTFAVVECNLLCVFEQSRVGESELACVRQGSSQLSSSVGRRVYLPCGRRQTLELRGLGSELAERRRNCLDWKGASTAGCDPRVSLGPP